MTDEFLNQKACDRCGEELRVRTMSMFNVDVICMDCKERERSAPGYAAASKAEIAAIERGETEFPGIGLSDADKSFLGL